MAAGITQPGGAGTTIMIYDDTDTSGGRPAGSYTFAQISAAFPADFVDVTVNVARPKYKSLVDLQMGDDIGIVCTTNGTTLLTSAALFGPVATGQTIIGAGIIPGTTITKTDNSNITLSQAATNSSTTSRTFFTGARATTTLQATKSDLDFAATHGLKSAALNPCPWHFNMGTRIDTPDGKVGWKDGCNIVFGSSFNGIFQLELYDTVLRQAGTGVLSLAGADAHTDIQRIAGCHLQNTTTGTQPSQLGASGGNIDQLLDTLLSYDTTSFCVNNASFDQCERVTVTCATPTAFIRAGGSGVAVKDFRVVGSPTTTDFIWTSAGAANWVFIRPVYSQSGCNKFSIVSGDLPINGATTEYWLFDTTIVDRNGNPVAGIPVTLIDATGVTAFSGVTNSSGAISFNVLDFGSIVCTTNGTTTLTSAGMFGPLPTVNTIVTGTGINDALAPTTCTKIDNSTLSLSTAAIDSSTQARAFFLAGYLMAQNAVAVIDHYTSGGVYTQRHRSPFTYAINVGAGANPNYQGRRGTFYWPGYPTVTKNAGTFEDVAMVINIEDPSGGPTAWTELTL